MRMYAYSVNVCVGKGGEWVRGVRVWCVVRVDTHAHLSRAYGVETPQLHAN